MRFASTLPAGRSARARRRLDRGIDRTRRAELRSARTAEGDPAMKTAVLTACILTFGVVTEAAADGPAWCAAIGNNRVDTSSDIKDALEDGDPRNTIKNLV